MGWGMMARGCSGACLGLEPLFCTPAPPFLCVVCMGGPFPSPPPPGVSILRPAFWGVCARDRDYNSSLEGDGLGWSASSLRIPAGIGKSRHPSYPHIPRRWRERRPTGLEPSRPGYSWANEVSGAALPWGGWWRGRRKEAFKDLLPPFSSPVSQSAS